MTADAWRGTLAAPAPGAISVWPAFLNFYAALCLATGRLAFRAWRPWTFTWGAVKLGWKEAREGDKARRLAALHAGGG